MLVAGRRLDTSSFEEGSVGSVVQLYSAAPQPDHSLIEMRDREKALEILSPNGEKQPVLPVCSLCFWKQTDKCPHGQPRPLGCSAFALDERDVSALEQKILKALTGS